VTPCFDAEEATVKYLLVVDYQPGAVDTPMDEWPAETVTAHLDYYAALNKELEASGELVGGAALTPPPQAKVVTSDGTRDPLVTDGPYAEFKEWLAGYQLVDVASEARAIEIAARVSAAPGPGGVPLQQPVQVRKLLD
jgi:hypothetical protein